MNNDNLSNALDDVKLIKNIINQTARSLGSIGEIFLKWGVLFFIHAGVYLTIVKSYSNKIITFEVARISLILALLIASIISILIYTKVSKNKKTVALEKKLLVIWFCIIAFTFLHSNLSYNIGVWLLNKPIAIIGGADGPTSIINATRSNISFGTIGPIYLLFYAFGLFITSIFTEFKQPKYIALIYTIIGFMYPHIDIKELSLLVAPLTFLYLGVYLKIKMSKEF